MLACIDDRGYDTTLPTIHIGGASPFGAAIDVYAARVLTGQHEVHMPLGEAAKIIAKTLARHAMFACTHKECLAELTASGLADAMEAHYDAVVDKAEYMYGGAIASSDFEQALAAFQAIQQSPRLYRGLDIETTCMDNDGRHPRIVRQALANAAHRATTLDVAWDKSTLVSVAESYAAGAPRYRLDAGYLGDVSANIATTIPHENDHFVIANMIRNAVISETLPRGGDMSAPGIDVIRYDEAA